MQLTGQMAVIKFAPVKQQSTCTPISQTSIPKTPVLVTATSNDAKYT